MWCVADNSLSDHIDLFALYGLNIEHSLLVGGFSHGGDLFADCCLQSRNHRDFVSGFIAEHIELADHSVLDYN